MFVDVRMTSEKSAQFLDAGIGIISVPDFLQTYAGKPIPAPMVAIPRPSKSLIFLKDFFGGIGCSRDE